MSGSETYRRAVEDVGRFLSRLHLDWTPFSNECCSRALPPLVIELEDRMGVLSPTLQGVVFTATRRNLGLNEEAGKRMEDLFLQDRKGHREFAARVNSGRPPAVS
ncbi:hypothetical protein DL95DRAFT_399021, partial [Leptodontidium sp. 2 PMI_412]